MIQGKSMEVAQEMLAWYKVARAARWHNFDDVRRHYPSADQVGSVLIFNVRHNRFRLITAAVYEKQRLYLKALLTHKEYDREEWKKWV
jgi:mRNA interferase HigB